MHLCTYFLLLADREFADGGRQPPGCGTRAAAAKSAGVKHICKVSSCLVVFLQLNKILMSYIYLTKQLNGKRHCLTVESFVRSLHN